MRQVYKNRLLKLVNHLRNGKLAHKKFDYSVYSESAAPIPEGACGTSGCALGECPAIFRGWKWTSVTSSSPGLYRARPLYKDIGKVIDSSCEFFGLTEDQALYLFHVPSRDDNTRFNCSRKFIAVRIKRFVEDN